MCNKEGENELHIFKECKIINMIAFMSMWTCNLRAWEVVATHELVKLCLDPPKEINFELEKE